MAIFKGAGVALVTPMKENLEVDFDRLAEILRMKQIVLLLQGQQVKRPR